MRKLLLLNEARQILEPHHQNIVESIEGGFADYLKIKAHADSLSSSPVQYHKRTSATIIHDQVRHRIINKYVNAAGGVVAKDWNDIFALKLQDDLFVRFKKISFSSYRRKHVLPGYPTPQFLKFLGQGQIEGFPETPTFVFAGYIPNPSWTSINGVYIACWLGETLLWIDDIGRFSLEQLNLFKTIDTRKTSVRRVKLKNKDLNETNKGLSATGTDTP
jgi:hypothetical protein